MFLDDLEGLFNEFSTPVSMGDGIERRALTFETLKMIVELKCEQAHTLGEYAGEAREHMRHSPVCAGELDWP